MHERVDDASNLHTPLSKIVGILRATYEPRQNNAISVNLSETLQADYRGHKNCINAALLIVDGDAVFIQPKTGDRLHAYEDDYARSANHYKGDPDGGYRAFVFTNYVSAEQIVKLRDRVERGIWAALRIPF